MFPGWLWASTFVRQRTNRLSKNRGFQNSFRDSEIRVVKDVKNLGLDLDQMALSRRTVTQRKNNQHLCRSAIIGSTRDALRAGIRHASAPEMLSTTIAADRYRIRHRHGEHVAADRGSQRETPGQTERKSDSNQHSARSHRQPERIHLRHRSCPAKYYHVFTCRPPP